MDANDHIAEFTPLDEVLLRRELLVSAPERAAHLMPIPSLDWCARMMTREHSAPLPAPYTGPERRRAVITPRPR